MFEQYMMKLNGACWQINEKYESYGTLPYVHSLPISTTYIQDSLSSNSETMFSS
jgi:hypothetical protein